MKNAALLLGLILFSLFLGCKKQEHATTTDDNQAVMANVNTWLQSQTATADTAGVKRIALLQQSLDGAHLYTEDYANQEKFIVIPVTSKFVSLNNADKEHSTVLIVFLTPNGIRKANIVQYSGTLPHGTFTEIFNSRVPNYSGTLSFLTVTDSRAYDITYADKKMKSHSLMKSKPGTKANNRTGDCYEAYWVTYYPNGETTWDFLFSWCDNDVCNETRTANNISIRANCGGGTAVDCCIPDDNMQLNSQSISDERFCQSSDLGGQKKTSTCRWAFSRNSMGWYVWTYNSIETADLDASSGTWKFVTLSHTGTETDGDLPFCATITLNVTSAVPNYSTDRTTANMRLNFSISYKNECLPGSPTHVTSSYSQHTFIAN